MTKIFNRFRQRENRKQLRKTPVEAEAILWSRLKNKQQHGIRYRRQYSVGRYVVDFYCPSAKLVIELDGSSHDDQEIRQYDHLRDQFLKSLGLRILRFKNNEIRRNLSDVLRTIQDEVS